jgi:DNA-binding protein HU-beta
MTETAIPNQIRDREEGGQCGHPIRRPETLGGGSREGNAPGAQGGQAIAPPRHLKKGNKVGLTGLGILQVRKLAARMGRNPATGEAIKIKASKKIAFRPTKELKETV